MREAIAVMDRSMQDPEALLEADLDFHRALTETVANPIILALLDSIVAVLREQRSSFFGFEGDPERGEFHHKQILDAIEQRDPVMAREAMRSHLQQVRED
jgi:GntR family transcriptional repressor for pyruvate dehydrogenase complex